MTRATTRRLCALALAAVASTAAHAETLIGLTSTNALVRFDSSMPTNASSPVTISGLASFNERVIGIDLRPRTGVLYGLSDRGNLYTLNATTGAATFVAGLVADPGDMTSPYAGLQGSSIGIDFNPVPDNNVSDPPSLRVMTNAGQNLRINVNAPNVGRTLTDATLNGATSMLDAVAYSNNDRDPNTGTTLYGIDMATDTLYSLVANAGTSTAIGGLGVNTIGVAGFDISGATRIAYAALTDGTTGKSGLYTLNLASGAASWVGDFGIGGSTSIAPPLVDLTVAAIPEPGTYALMLAGLAMVGFSA
ncbi:MAG: DUF4394 domain-containing protein, partial [Aquabacterium sp.]